MMIVEFLGQFQPQKLLEQFGKQVISINPQKRDFMLVNQKKITLLEISIFFILFMIAHTFELYLNAHTLLKSHYILALFVRLIIWTLPVILLTLKQNPLKYLKLYNNVFRGLTIGIITGLIIITLRCLIIYLIKGFITFNFNIPVGFWLNGIIFVGLSEEVVFRGYLLQKIESISSFWIANIISAVLFAIMHFPIWIMVKNLGALEIIGEIRSMIFMGLIFGYVFKKAQSLWSPIIVHSVNNFMSIVIN